MILISFYSSVNKGVDFVLTASFNSNVNAIEVHHSNSNIIYVTTSGNGVRGVFRSIDKGVNFENITYDLPRNQAYLDIAHQGTSFIKSIICSYFFRCLYNG